MHQGSCLCGAVRFEIAGDIPAPNGCHCTNCRKQTGHYLVSTEVPKAQIQITGEALRWYQSSPKVRRGFCAICGSTLFFDPPHLSWIAVAMGALDGPSGTKMSHHIFVSQKGDYYDLADGLPQNQT